MSTEFAINLFEFGDVAGAGAYEIGHYRQHLRYNAVLAGKTPPVILPTYPILHLTGDNKRELRFWLDQHESWHEQLRTIAGITGANLADLDYTDPHLFLQWLDVHKQEHALLDQFFGVA